METGLHQVHRECHVTHISSGFFLGQVWGCSGSFVVIFFSGFSVEELVLIGNFLDTQMSFFCDKNIFLKEA